MTIERGQPWGSAGELPTGRPIVASDAELVAAVEQAGGPWSVDERPGDWPTGQVVGLAGGDLWRTLGAPSAARIGTSDAMWFPIDLAVASTPRGTWRFAAHAVWGPARWFSSPTLIAMNASFIGDANLGPRAHPNDGYLDLTEGQLGWADRRKARARFAAGTHVPHPQLSTRRLRRSETFHADRPRPLTLDGRSVDVTAQVTFSIIPDAAMIVA